MCVASDYMHTNSATEILYALHGPLCKSYKISLSRNHSVPPLLYRNDIFNNIAYSFTPQTLRELELILSEGS